MREKSKNEDYLRKDLTGADLSHKELSCAIMYEACLRGADLHNSCMLETVLRFADLTEANLRGVTLCRAYMQGAVLCGADLSRANLSGADLRDTDFRGADLTCAVLRGADLTGADIRDAKFACADLTDAKMPDPPMACPETGSFVGYTKAGGYVVVLEVPEDAKRSSATTARCRCDKAKVVAILTPDGKDAGIDRIPSDRDSDFVYEIGKVVSVSDFDTCRWHECSTRIHFFADRERAVIYL